MLRAEDDTFHPYSRRRTANVLAVVVEGLAAIALVMSGSLTTTTPRAPREDPAAGAYRQFLDDVPNSRPSGEVVVDSGTSKAGLPVSLQVPPETAPRTRRIIYRCHGQGSATATGYTAVGTRHRFPHAPCGPTIASLDPAGYTTVILGGSDDQAILLWASATVSP